MTFVSIVVILIVVVMLFEKQFIFFPDKYPAGQYLQAANIPGLTDCWMTTEDGIKLHGWFLPADSAIATLVMPHGNAGNISNRYVIMIALRKYGFNVLMFDYRGYGKSDGIPSEEGIYIDGRTAFDYAAKLPQVDSQKIVLWGTSLGGAVAVDVATKRQAACLILESTFTSAADMAAVHYPFLPVRYLLRTQLNSIEKIAQIHTPLLVMHGNNDRTVPIQFGKSLYASANEPKEFYEIVGADHNNTYMAGGAAYFKKVREFVLKYTSQKR
jgi:fermentation-respiration switch protein FrsA (DUF1100 family)